MNAISQAGYNDDEYFSWRRLQAIKVNILEEKFS